MRHLVALLALALALPAPAKEVSGVQVPETATAGGKALILNGAGLRSSFFVKIYVGALYLEQRSSDPAAIVAADAPWKVTLTFKRDVEKKQMLEKFKEGFEKNSAADLADLLPGLARLDAAMKDLKAGDVLEFTYLPGAGSTITSPGVSVTIEGRPFAAALLRNWLGDKPADGDLKSGMLGK